MPILDELREMVIKILGLDPDIKITLGSSFTEDLGADSLDMVELIMAVEEKWKVEILDEDAEKLITVKDALDYLEAKGVAIE